MNNIHNSHEQPDFSLVLGGPLFQLLVRSRLATPALDLLYRRIVFISMFAWLPLLLLSLVNGKEVAKVQVPVSAPLLFTANDCLDIGTDLGSPVSTDYFDNAPFDFNGKIDSVNVKYIPAK